jgi:subtilase family serine protease
MAMSVKRKRRILVAPFIATMVLGINACAPASTTPSTRIAGAPRGSLVSFPQHPSIGDAIARGADLGPLPASAPLQLTLGLANRDPAGLDALLASGQHVTPAEYTALFGPDPQAVSHVQSVLNSSGFSASWTPGAALLIASGSVGAADRLFGVRIDQRVGPDGVRFFAPAHAPAIPASLQPAVNGFSGLDNYPRLSPRAVRSVFGLTPSDAMDFYDMTSLRNAGLDGAGITVVFIEIDRFDPAMLDEFAAKFTPGAPFNVEVHSDSAHWGDPMTEKGETDMDLEIVHALAPRAKEVVYYAAPDDRLYVAEQALFAAYPQGAVESKSLGQCEPSEGRASLKVIDDATKAAAAQGWSIFVASGDAGAFTCTPSGDPNTLAVSGDAAVDNVTAVGGTTAMLSATGGYYKEAAWGEPISQWGSGGGLSMFFERPGWQAGPGVANQYSNGMRQVPDVSGNADPLSGWDIFSNGMEQPGGGTSASAPFWAACAALIDQNLSKKGLPLIGFANPALYRFTQGAPGLPAPALHDVSTGTNLYYPATQGWDYSTGLGTPDVAALADDFDWYEGKIKAGQHP